MGSSKSKLIVLDSELKNLKNLFMELKGIDRNNDGVISKDEFQIWKNEQKDKMGLLEKKMGDRVTDKYNKTLIDQERDMADAKKKIDELIKQINSLKTINNTLEQKLLVENAQNLNLPQGKLQELSKQRIDEFVEKLLADKNVNIGYLPDFVERQIYKNVFNLLIGLLDDTISTTSIKMLGHNLTFNIAPDIKESTDIIN